MLISEYIRVLNKLGFWTFQGYTRFSIQYLVIRAWQYSEYALESEYAIVLNMLRLDISLWIKFSNTDIWQGSEYALSSEYACVTQGSEENSPLHMFDKFLSGLSIC